MRTRYLTITIQYYPVPKKFLLALCLLFFVWPLITTIQTISKQWLQTPLVGNVYAADKFHLAYAATLQEEKKDEYENQKPYVQINGVISHGPRHKKEIALTFDADMTPGMKKELQNGKVATYYDANMIRTLTETQTKATFFLAGMWIELYSAETKQMATNPLFELSNHSYSHPSFDGNCYGLGAIPDEADQQEIQKTQELLKSVAGVTNSYFRFPGGCYSQKDLAIVHQAGLEVVHWDVIGHDGFNHDEHAIENNILPHVQNGSIIVLHLGGSPNTPKTAEVLPHIISELKKEGFVFVKVSELLKKSDIVSQKDLIKSYLLTNRL